MWHRMRQCNHSELINIMIHRIAYFNGNLHFIRKLLHRIKNWCQIHPCCNYNAVYVFNIPKKKRPLFEKQSKPQTKKYTNIKIK